MNYIIPLTILGIISYGVFKKINIYDTFLDGSKEGLHTIFNILPSILAMVVGVNIFLKSGVLYFFLSFLEPVLKSYDLSLEILAMGFLRPISGSASFAIMNSIYKIYGVDSFMGFLASVMEGATDTTIYVLALYFGSIKIVKTRYALKVGLFADLCGLVTAFIVSTIFF